jgi:hypothetical protein
MQSSCGARGLKHGVFMLIYNKVHKVVLILLKEWIFVVDFYRIYMTQNERLKGRNKCINSN